MPCVRVKLPDGGVALLCGVKRSVKACGVCGGLATRLCDGPAPAAARPGQTTCDTPLCGRCTTRVGRAKDLCPNCAREDRQLVLPGSR